jgi:hypothetical protein
VTIPLITDQDELDMIAMGERAHLRACADWGSMDYPPARRRQAVEWVMDRALAERYAWRRDHGLPDDTETTLTPMPAWGDSGDNFGAR